MLRAVNEDSRRDVALRLKAALWLAGRRGRPGTNEDPVVALTTSELSEHQLLIENDISRSKLDEVLRLRRDPKPMELRVIAEALELPASFFLAKSPFDEESRADRQRRDLTEALETIRILADRLQAQR
jgi:hypothetical protein